MKYLYFVGKIDEDIASKDYIIGNYFKDEKDALRYFKEYQCTTFIRYSKKKVEYFNFQLNIWVSERNW